jgi:type IV pilus assembly protein PilC
MATTSSKTADIKEAVYEWEGKDRNGKQVRGEMRAGGENQVKSALRRQGVTPTKLKKRRMRSGKPIKPRSSHFYPSACHHDEGRRAFAAGL